MAETSPLPPHPVSHIAQILNLPASGVRSIVRLLDDGATVPFLARYRKETTGNLDEVRTRRPPSRHPPSAACWNANPLY
ncbi:MAG: Tex-like N-terminal domain-containing protein [Acidobacteriota bacterium]